jgi:hypothetical protein
MKLPVNTMRIVLTPNEPEKYNPESETNIPPYRFAFKFMRGSGNIHIFKTEIIEEIYETVNSNVMVLYKDSSREEVENYHISSIEGLDS